MYTTDRAGATGQMLDIIEQSDEPGKWQQFLDALKDVGRTGTQGNWVEIKLTEREVPLY